MNSDNEVLLHREGALGRIRLNRPQALNALTHGMCAAMLEQLKAWAEDSAIASVLIDAVPGRAFCAGGDLRAIYELGRARDPKAHDFFATEYRLNATIKHYPKPYVALIDGIAMGGGLGVSVHGSHRIAGERAVAAMPETAIGLFPDVGGTYFLPRLPGEIGLYLALTGARLGPEDMVYSGIATHFAPAAHFPAIAKGLAKGRHIDEVLASLGAEPSAPPLAAHRAAIDRAFAAASVEEVIEALGNEGDFGRKSAALIASHSPTSLKLTFRAMREGRRLDFDSCLRMEYRLTTRVLEGHDFYEGVRALLIDKDRRPRWHPAVLAAVSDADIDRYFAPLGQGDLAL